MGPTDQTPGSGPDPSGSAARDPVENRDCVLVIQGGGIFALSLLGQAIGVLKKGYNPLAYAGTSAGALVATLLWGKVPIVEVMREIDSISGRPGGLTTLLGEPDPHAGPAEPRGFRVFTSILSSGKRFAAAFGGPDQEPRPWLAQRVWWGLRDGMKLKGAVAGHAHHRGLYPAGPLVEFVDRLLKKAPDLPQDLKEKRGLLTFGDYLDAEQKDENRRIFRMPLFITATNLSTQRLEVISSMDVAYRDVAVAQAVRASTAVPLFFRPVDLPECGNGGTFVDGGLISNFPSWIFSRATRVWFEEHAWGYWDLICRPVIHVGLRLGSSERRPDARTPGGFVGSLVSMAVGGSRNELERRLNRDGRRTLTIEQPETAIGGPKDFLAFDQAGEHSRAMILNGQHYAMRRIDALERPQLYNPRAELGGILRTLIETCFWILRDRPKPAAHAAVYAVAGEQLRPLAEHDSLGRPDRALVLEDTASGLTGQAFWVRAPMVCNLKEVREQSEAVKRIYGMDADQHTKVYGVKPPPTWMASVPCFDPYEIRTVMGKEPIDDFTEANPPHPTGSHHTIPTLHRGPVIAVLSLDLAVRYSDLDLRETASEHFQNPYVQAIVNAMNDAASEVAVELAGGFPDDSGMEEGER